MGRDFNSPELRRFSVDSSTSTSSTESSFRELDDVFLQTQTRIWLGEVLHTRLNEEVLIADLLADGKLLFQVSCVIGKMLLTKCKDLKNSKAYMSEKAESGKRSRRYMPYSNVDSFLKICNMLGLTGIDLFSPSDVVEKKGSRRVCMCIRSLSKKARLRGLNVPDFDVVTYTIAMPTDMVKGIRRSLEKAQYRILTSADSDSGLDTRPKYCQKNWVADCVKQHDSYSEESDDAESNYNAFGSDSPVSSVSTHSTPVVEAQGEVERESGACQSMSISVMNGSHHEQHPESNYPPRAETLRDYTSERDYLGFESGNAGFVSHEGGNTLPFNLQRHTNSLGSNSVDRDSTCELIRSFSEEIEDFEVSSTYSGNSISGTVGTIDYEDPFEAEDDSFNRDIPQLQMVDSGLMDACSVSDYEPLEMIDYEDVGSACKPLAGAETGPDFGETQNSIVPDEKSFSVPISDIAGIIYNRNDQADLHGGNDGYFPQMHEPSSLAAQDIDKLKSSKWDIGVLTSPVSPCCLEGSDADPDNCDGTGTPNILYVDKLVVHHNHDVPLGASALSPENDLYEAPATSVHKDNNDQHLVDEKNFLVGQKAATSQDKDVVYTTDTIGKEDIDNLKIEKHGEQPKSKQRKAMVLKSVAGGVTLLGVFLLFQLRRKDGKEKIKETLVPSVQINKPGPGEASSSRQNKQHGNRLDRVYPGGNFEF
ncbi:uncharacterized protein LOC113301298 isoform X1 [Papaver somniferum]|nr:uncharacterized protein LOC113301298 isoform X1 [Papaver somniferum]